MRYLLDTHVWLWMLSNPAALGERARTVIEDRTNELLLSAASSWEIAIKNAIGRLPLPSPPAQFVPDRMSRTGVIGLPVEHAHALRVATLPAHHRDPFDRLLVAQAQVLGMALITADEKFAPYEIQLVPAGRRTL
ncbi:MAG TPA: type II toxin-antitoxin system VapC family toxin [Actinomycetota bacterium]|nr:type II toxin-antitoxin system VapC family toxin [Actinomycetota bacterium]